MSIPTVEAYYITNNQRLVKSLTFRLGTKEAAEDVVHEAFYRSLKYIHSYSPERKFDKWFNTILRNCIRDFKNEEMGHPTKDEDPDDIEDDVHLPYNLINDFKNDILNIINDKSKIHKEILNYYYICNYSVKDISEITDFKYKMIHQVVLRFKKELKEMYG